MDFAGVQAKSLGPSKNTRDTGVPRQILYFNHCYTNDSTRDLSTKQQLLSTTNKHQKRSTETDTVTCPLIYNSKTFCRQARAALLLYS